MAQKLGLSVLTMNGSVVTRGQRRVRHVLVLEHEHLGHHAVEAHASEMYMNALQSVLVLELELLVLDVLTVLRQLLGQLLLRRLVQVHERLCVVVLLRYL